MSAEQSQQMMELLQELAMLKKLDEREGGDGSDEGAAVESREKRRHEIAEQIKVLGDAAA